MQKRVHLKENTCKHLGSIPNACIKMGKKAVIEAVVIKTDIWASQTLAGPQMVTVTVVTM